MRRLFKRYQQDCRTKNVYWELTIEEFKELTSAPCAYCDRLPAQKSRKYIYNGIDRMDNNKGYTRDNCVPACKECNFIKGNRLTAEEMRVVGQALSSFRKTKI